MVGGARARWCRDRCRRWRRSTAAPTPSTSRPDVSSSHGSRSSGSTAAESASATAPEREHAGGVRDGDDAAERDGVARRPARADEVRGDHRLAVAGRERVQRAPAERQRRSRSSAPWPAAASENASVSGSPPRPSPDATGAASDAARVERAVAGRDPQRRGAHVGRAREPVRGIAAQAARRVRRGDVGDDRGPLPRLRDDRLPADPPAVRAVAQHDPRRVRGAGAERQLGPRGRQPGAAGRPASAGHR